MSDHFAVRPFDGRPDRVRVGLRELDPSLWLSADDRYDDDIAERRAVFAAHEAEVSSERGPVGVVAAAAEELLELVRRHHEVAAGAPDPLAAAGLGVQDDLCLLHRLGDRWTLVAGFMCFPSRWRLSDKLGRGLAEIHAPVPGYEGAIARAVDARLDRLAPGVVLARGNWMIHDTPERFQPSPPPPMAAAGPDEAGERLFLRTEFQTLRSLPDTGVCVFAIRTRVSPLSSIAGTDQAAAAIRAAFVQESTPTGDSP